jgi:hypothetical protein
MLGELKLEIIFTSQIASCIAGSAVPVDVPIFAQTAATFESQNNIDASTNLLNDNTDISTNALSATTKIQRRINIQKFTANFTTGDTGVPTAGNIDISFNKPLNTTAAQVAADTNAVYNISNIVLHIETYQFKTDDYYNVMKELINNISDDVNGAIFDNILFPLKFEAISFCKPKFICCVTNLDSLILFLLKTDESKLSKLSIIVLIF